MSSQAMLLELSRHVLTREIVDSFDLVDISLEDNVLHLHLDESDFIPAEYKDKELFVNGFYEASSIKDFPLRDKKVILAIRRRRWIDESGKSYSRQWDLTASGTRYSKEFAYFLKEAFGYLPDSSPIT